MRRRRLRTWAKWACTLAAGACVGVAVASGWWDLTRSAPSHSSGGNEWEITRGMVCCASVVRDDTAGARWYLDPNPGWLWGWRSDSNALVPSGACFGFVRWHIPRYADRYGMSLVYPVLLTTIPAALLWYKDRRRFGPGRCKKCGYDRAGLDPHAKCPECGTVPQLPST